MDAVGLTAVAILLILALLLWALVASLFRGIRNLFAPATTVDPKAPLPTPDHHIEGDGTYAFEVIGESHHQDALTTIVGGKTRQGHQHDCIAILVRDPSNRHDRNAIIVAIDGHKVGFIPAEVARAMAPRLDRQGIKTATAHARIIGGWLRPDGDEGHFGVVLDIT